MSARVMASSSIVIKEHADIEVDGQPLSIPDSIEVINKQK